MTGGNRERREVGCVFTYSIDCLVRGFAGAIARLQQIQTQLKLS